MGDKSCEKNAFWNISVSAKTVIQILCWVAGIAFAAGVALWRFAPAATAQPASTVVQPAVAEPAESLTQLELRVERDFVRKDQHAQDIEHVGDTMKRIDGNINRTLDRMEQQQTESYGRIQKAQTALGEDLKELDQRIDEMER